MGQDADFYTGKRVAYVYHGYKAKRCVRWNQAPARRSNTRALWGRITRVHGNSGAVRAKFAKNMPASAIGRRVRVTCTPAASRVLMVGSTQPTHEEEGLMATLR